MAEGFGAMVAMVRPFADKAAGAGFDVEIRLRGHGQDIDTLIYRSGVFAAEDLRDDPLCPDDRRTDD